MAYFKTGYDASTMTVSVNDEEVYRALGVLADKAPAALKVAVIRIRHFHRESLCKT